MLGLRVLEVKVQGLHGVFHGPAEHPVTLQRDCRSVGGTGKVI